MASNKIIIKIEGEVGKHKTLAVDFLNNLSSQLQNLLQNIARYDLPSDESINIDDFKIELIDFKKGSAIPIFAFRKESQATLHSTVSEQRKICSDKFNDLMIVSGKGDYLVLKKKYPEPDKRRKMTESLYGFVQSTGTSPVTIKVDGNKRGHKIKPFKKTIHDKLVNEVIITKKVKEEALSHIQLAKVEVTEGKIKPKVLELYDKKYNHVEYAPEIIIFNGKTYELKYPLLCTMDNEDGQIVIENKQLGIFVAGETTDQAEELFNEEFDYLYTRYNQLKDNQLTDDVKFIKELLNHIVKK